MAQQFSTLHCSNKECNALLLSRMALAEGTTFVIKCHNCGKFTKVIASFNIIHKRLLSDIKKDGIINTNTSEFNNDL